MMLVSAAAVVAVVAIYHLGRMTALLPGAAVNLTGGWQAVYAIGRWRGGRTGHVASPLGGLNRWRARLSFV
eukprot:scaffold10115_cov95-Skeletonema_dohrnii-CCMP3373.AAC.11